MSGNEKFKHIWMSLDLSKIGHSADKYAIANEVSSDILATNKIKIKWVTQKNGNNECVDKVTQAIKKEISHLKGTYDYDEQIDIDLHYIVKDNNGDKKYNIYTFSV